MFLGLKWVQILQMWTQKFLCSTKISNRRLSKPYDISSNQTETDTNVNNCWLVFPVWCNTQLQHRIPAKYPSIICTCKYYFRNFTKDNFFSHLCVYAKINNVFPNRLKLFYLEVHKSTQNSANFIECISLIVCFRYW